MEQEGTFDTGEFTDELAVAAWNGQLGTSLWFEDDRIRVWELKLEPGERGAFHIHDHPYFWTVVDPGRGLQRFSDGRFVIRDYALGETRHLNHSPENHLIHDLENVGDTTLRFVTVSLLS